MNIKIIKSFKDLDDIELKKDWHELWNKSLNAEVFLTYEWVYVWCKHFINNHKNKKLFIILIYNDKNILEAIVPLYNEKYFIFFKILKFINDKRSDYLGFLIDKDSNFENILNSIINFLDGQNGINIIYLKQISEELSNAIIKKNPTKLKIILQNGINSYYTYLPESVDIFMKRYNAKQRYNNSIPIKEDSKKWQRYNKLR